MKIKKFTCTQCGAPKVNPYTLPYIICDFCGSFTDIDFSVGMDVWNKDPKRTNEYNDSKLNIENKLAEQLGKNDKEGYQKTQYAYWDLYYKTFPEYLPPSVNTKEYYSIYLEICALSSTEAAFDKDWTKKAGEQSLLQQSILFHAEDGKTIADGEAFFKLADFYIGFVKESFKDFYDRPEFSIMHELLPPELHLKMKLSMFVQAWIPYLTESDAKKLLELSNFSNEYIELSQPNGILKPCEHCSKEIFVPKGSYKINCQHCHKTNTIVQSFDCSSCGMVNQVPENPAKPAKCTSCGTENKLIKPELGGL